MSSALFCAAILSTWPVYPPPRGLVEDEMLLAIAQQPGNLVNIQSYGDWLAERGHPFGEYVQIQLLLAREGGAMDPARRRTLEARAGEILGPHVVRWWREASGMAPAPLRLEYGIPVEVNMARWEDDAFAVALNEFLKRVPTVRRVTTGPVGSPPVRDPIGEEDAAAILREPETWGGVRVGADASVTALGARPWGARIAVHPLSRDPVPYYGGWRDPGQTHRQRQDFLVRLVTRAPRLEAPRFVGLFDEAGNLVRKYGTTRYGTFVMSRHELALLPPGEYRLRPMP